MAYALAIAVISSAPLFNMISDQFGSSGVKFALEAPVHMKDHRFGQDISGIFQIMS